MINDMDFFKNKKDEIQYCVKCQQCNKECKQSYKIKYISCPKFNKK